MELVTPGIGLVFWMTVSFLLILFLLTKFAWKPILKAVKERELTIEEALAAADKAKEEMKKLERNNQNLLQQARDEREALLKDARESKEQIITEARGKAREEAEKILTAAREEIRNEKARAVNDLKAQVGDIAFQIAEKVLSEKLADSDKQSATVTKALSEVHFN